MTDFLHSMAVLSADRAAAVTQRFTSADFDAPVHALTLNGFDVIAEIKDRSPAEGELATDARDRATQARNYAAGGAAAISVLTEPTRFAGSLEHMEEVIAAVPNTPVMRKDFLVEPVQVLEARAAGASGILLIATMLADNKLREMLDCAYDHGMFVLLESFDADDLARAVRLLGNAADRDHAANGQLLYGVNTRNLRTLHVDPERLRDLATELPQARCVAESGLHDANDAATVAAYGYELALVGTALMRSSDPATLIREMRAAGSAGIAA